MVALLGLHGDLAEEFTAISGQDKPPPQQFRKAIKKTPKRSRQLDEFSNSASHMFVRLLPKTQHCMQYMLKNKHFPRLELKYLAAHSGFRRASTCSTSPTTSPTSGCGTAGTAGWSSTRTPTTTSRRSRPRASPSPSTSTS